MKVLVLILLIIIAGSCKLRKDNEALLRELSEKNKKLKGLKIEWIEGTTKNGKIYNFLTHTLICNFNNGEKREDNDYLVKGYSRNKELISLRFNNGEIITQIDYQSRIISKHHKEMLHHDRPDNLFSNITPNYFLYNSSNYLGTTKIKGRICHLFQVIWKGIIGDSLNENERKAEIDRTAYIDDDTGIILKVVEKIYLPQDNYYYSYSIQKIEIFDKAIEIEYPEMPDDFKMYSPQERV